MWRMYYAGYYNHWRIGLALSKDGIHFEKYYDNPILDLGPDGSWDDSHIYYPSIIYINNQYYIYYAGYNATQFHIGLALSKDGIHFEKYYDNPILDLGPDGSWDDTHVSCPYMIHINNQWQLYYTASDGINWRIGLALSKDGIHFEKYYDNPILDLGPDGSWDDTHVSRPYVIYINNQWRLYYMGYDGSYYYIGLALSKDGIHFEKYHDNPILDPGPSGSWDAYHINRPYVIYINNQWRLYYASYDGSNWYIEVALSKDGIHFEKYHDNPILDPGPSGSWDNYHVSSPCVIKV